MSENSKTMEYTTILRPGGLRCLQAVWRINQKLPFFQTVDVLLRPLTNPDAALSKVDPQDTPHRFLLDSIGDSPRAIKLILPTVNGFIGRGNFFERRLLECGFAERVQGFLALGQRTGPPKLASPSSESFHSLVSSVSAGILLTIGSDTTKLALLETDLASRLSLNWIFPSPAPHRNVVLIEGYAYLQTGAGFIQAVKDLNVSVIVLGTGEPHGPKHWLQNPDNAPGFCDAFIPIDMTIDDALPLRIVAAVRGYTGFDTVDGILTGHDRYLVPTAKAAHILGLPASPIRAHEIATDKYAMRRFEVNSQRSDFQFLRFTGLDDIKQQLTAPDPTVVRYPAIVKPVNGYLSEGVARVSNDAELLASVARIDNKRHGHAVIVETYVDGPEFDANIVLCEGEILFFELVDDFPSAGDQHGAGATGTFFETSEFTPSNLPPAERELVKSSLHQTLLGLGFTWGLFHVEGRVKDSTMEFRADACGVVDLRPRRVPRQNLPACFLVEINARIPGLGCAMSTMHAYGVDFYASHLLACLRDAQRLRLVATPFRFPARPDGSQYWCEVVFIQPDRGGVFNTADPCGALLQRHPALAANVSQHLCCYAKGDVIPDPATGVCLLLAYFLAYSAESREHVRTVAETIRAEFQYDII
ncbi:ATP-grasp domain-containing protein [Mycena maculata]|uniref:ATP-grasp domain-containing protein n=1 Tax=Mycena maculata TaxID=230809 RepID=A0AAD7MHZ4_9AGAR|nr:ATP-grasp domain-containing protein [Mycena maculata]